MKCPECNEEMIQGFVPDHGDNIFVGEWFEGRPKKSFWTGVKTPHGKSLKIAAFRCMICGLVEFYADAKFAPK